GTSIKTLFPYATLFRSLNTVGSPPRAVSGSSWRRGSWYRDLDCETYFTLSEPAAFRGSPAAASRGGPPTRTSRSRGGPSGTSESERGAREELFGGPLENDLLAH